MSSDAGYAIVSTTVGSEGEARTLAHDLVAARLAGCVQILPIHSVYRWQGQVEDAPEHLLLIKIRAAAFATVAEHLRAIHPYEVPEIVMTRIEDGTQAYLGWLNDATEPSAPD